MRLGLSRLQALRIDRAILALSIVLVAAATAADARVRKNYKDLTAQERQDYVDAVKWLKNNTTTYDDFVRLHNDNFSTGALHTGPSFLAWHRKYLLEFENALRAANNGAWSNITIPYWDSAEDPFPRHKVDANADNLFMGGNGILPSRTVQSGPFASSTGEWTLTVGPTADLRRSFGSFGTLPSSADVATALAVLPFDSPDYNLWSDPDHSFRSALEFVHNDTHIWVGQTMLDQSSPNDPVFWLHHANIDRLWCKWQEANSIDLHHLPLCGTHDPFLFDRPRPDGLQDGHCAFDDLTGYPGVTAADMVNLRGSGVEYDDCLGPCELPSGETTSQFMMATET